MEFMIAWFPALKIGISLLVAFILYLLFKNGHFKTGIVVLILTITFSMLKPYAYDGTNSISASRENVSLVDEKVELAIQEHPVAVVTPEKSFDEQMAIQEAASDARTAKLRKELGLE